MASAKKYYLPKRRKLEELEGCCDMATALANDADEQTIFSFDFDPKFDMGLDIEGFSKKIIETESMKTFCCRDILESNNYIVGPKGVGKTTFLLYALSKIRKRRDSVCICLCSTMMNQLPHKLWTKYVKRSLSDTAKCINWNQSVELVMTDISLKVQGKELYLFMDEGSEATPYQLLKFYSVAKDCIRKEWRVTFASSSGCRFQAEKTVCNAAANLLEHFHTREILPFTIKEAYQFLTSHQVNQKWHEEIVFSAGTVPMMLKVFVNTVTKRDFSRKLGTMTNLIELVISQLKLCKRDAGGRYQSSLVQSFSWLAKASMNSTISSSNLSDYYQSYIAQENLTFIVEKKKSPEFMLSFRENPDIEDSASLSGTLQRSEREANSTESLNRSKERETGGCASKENVEYTLFLSYPRSYTGLRNALLNVVPREKYNSPTVKGFFFEKDFLVKTVSSNHEWKVRAKTTGNETERSLTFSGISGASEQENGHISTMEGNKVYYLHAGHKAIDAVVRARGNDNIVYLLLIQISLSPYNKHDSKYEDIFCRLKEPGNEKSILEYYSYISGVSSRNALYLYVCPKQLLKPEQEIDSFIEVISGCTTRSGKTKPPHLIGLLEADCDLSAALCSLENDLSGN